jgi:uncharacterized protein (DUF486 family)
MTTHRTWIIRQMKPMLPTLQAIGLLTLSNVFMTFAWYAHLKTLNEKPWFIAAVANWGIALFVPFLMILMKQPFRLDFV